jgi:hypothetical protein
MMKRKPAITITTTILVSVLGAGLALAQSPRIIQNTRDTMNAVSNHQAAASNEALRAHESVPSVASATRAAKKPAAASAITTKKPARAATKAASSFPAHEHSVEARRWHHGRRGGAVLVGESVPGDPAAVVPEEQPVDGTASADATSGSAEGGNAASDGVVPDSKYAANGRRDPFISPVVSHAGGSGCSTGKKCLEIGAINLRGVVHSENGFIAVVSNGLNKAYFLRENDPVFNGYVMKITGDSVVFQETLQDRLGKTFTREVVKKITAPAV